MFGDNRNYNLGEVAAKILASLGPYVLPLVIDGVDRKSPVALRHFADVVFWLGPKGAQAAPLLAQSLQMDDWDLRRSVTRALSAIGADAKPAIPAMVDCLGLALENEDVLESIKNVEQSSKQSKEGFVKKGKAGFGGFPGGRNTAPVAVSILGDLLQIEPEIKGLLPKGMLRGKYAVYETASVSLWRQAHYALTERYPTERSKAAASTDPGAKGAGPRYLGKSASYWLNNLEDASPKARLLAVEALGNIAEKDKSLIPDRCRIAQGHRFRCGRHRV